MSEGIALRLWPYKIAQGNVRAMARSNKKIRRENLQRLINERFGTREALAEHADTSASHIGQILLGHRNLGDALAAKIEAACDLEDQWLDLPTDPAPGAITTLGSIPLITPPEINGWLLKGERQGVDTMPNTSAANGPRAFGIHVPDDSMMSPDIQQADALPAGVCASVDPDAPYSTGSIVLAAVGTGNPIIRRLADNAGQPFLLAANRNYPPHLGGFTVLGLVTGYIKTF